MSEFAYGLAWSTQDFTAETAPVQQFSLCAAKGCRVRAPGLQQHSFVEGVGRVPSPGGQ